MSLVFKNFYIFTLLFLSVLVIDIFIKLNFGVSTYRFISKLSIPLLLCAYYIVNQKETTVKKRLFIPIGLLFFMVGDGFLILHKIPIYYMIGIFSFIIAKLFYIFRFSNTYDFNLKRLLPFILLCFMYMGSVLMLMIKNLNSTFYIIVLLYLFIETTSLIFTILRKPAVNKLSFYLVLIGVLVSMFSASIAGLKSFYGSIAYQKITTMLFYAISQYLIIVGIVKETNK